MIGRVAPENETTYGAAFTRKNVQKSIAPNLSTSVTTGQHHSKTPPSLYRSYISDTAENTTYKRPGSFKRVLYQLPPAYASSVKANIEPSAPDSLYHNTFGRTGQTAIIKRSMLITPRQLSKTTCAQIEGTTKCTHYPPGYSGHIPREWKGNRGKQPFEDKTKMDTTWQYHEQKTGYGGYVPTCDMSATIPQNLKRTETTYRAMCDELGYTL